jgi:hypothetical protein
VFGGNTGSVVVLGVAVLLLLPVGAHAAQRLSDEHALSRWAHPAQLMQVRAHPDSRSRSVARLHWLTEDGRPEVYLALRATRDDAGEPWVQVRIPRRPNDTTGWVPRSALGALHVVRTALEIDRRRLRIRLRRDGRVVWSAPVGVGAVGTPTPAGRFYVREKLRNAFGDPLYGPWAIGTSAYSRLTDWPGGGVVGIHGTDQPQLIPGRPSHGCVRLENRDIAALVRRLGLGTPIWIH